MNKHESMRGYFSFELHKLMGEKKDVFLLVGDLGYGIFNQHRLDYPDRFINTGAAEQTLLDMAVGLAYGGKIPVVYSITPFLLYRPFETLRTYINHEKLNVKLIGSGRNRDYEHDGISHWSEDDRDILAQLPNIKQFYPETKEDVTFKLIKEVLESKDPTYINLRR